MLPIGYLCVVIGPAIFWSSAAFLVCAGLGMDSAARIAVLAFIATSAVLGCVGTMLRIKL